MQEVGETGGDWSLSPAWQRMSSLLTQLDSHVLERKLRLCQAALRPGPLLADCEEQVKLDLRHFEVDGSVTFNLSCLHCSGRGRDWDREDDDDDDTCVGCQGSGRHAPVVLDLAPYHPALDEAQLIARFLAMVVFRGGQSVLEGAGDGTAALPEKASTEAAVPELVWALDGEVLDEEDGDDELRELELVQLQVWEEGLQEQEQWEEEPVELQVREADLDQPRLHEEVGEEDEEEDERRREELREQLQVWEELQEEERWEAEPVQLQVHEEVGEADEEEDERRREELREQLQVWEELQEEERWEVEPVQLQVHEEVGEADEEEDERRREELREQLQVWEELQEEERWEVEPVQLQVQYADLDQPRVHQDEEEEERRREEARARYEEQEADVVQREEDELARRLAARGVQDHEEDEDDEDVAEYDFDAPPVLTLDVRALSRYGPGQQTRARNALLAPEFLRPVRKLTKVHCEFDQDWALQLLSDVSPRLEELQVSSPARQHLQVIEGMRHLTRLDVEFYVEGEHRSSARPPRAPDPPDLDEFVFRRPVAGSRRCGLRWLRVGHMPKLTTFSLLRAHRHTLEEAWLLVGSWRPDLPLAPLAAEASPRRAAADARWPASCRDLAAQLARGGATWPRLRRLVLYRWFNVHDRLTCLQQTVAVQQALPGVRVQCLECDAVPFLAF